MGLLSEHWRKAIWALQASYLNGALQVLLLGWMKNRTPRVRGQPNRALACSAGVRQFRLLAGHRRVWDRRSRPLIERCGEGGRTNITVARVEVIYFSN